MSQETISSKNIITFSTHVTDKELIFLIYKELSESVRKRTTREWVTIKSTEKLENIREFTENTTTPRTYKKMFNRHYNKRNAN